jgi:hypothetical protein
VDRNLKPEDYKRPRWLNAHVPSGWLPAQDIPLLIDTKKKLRGIEIGVCHGCSTHYLLKTTNAKIFAIDPYVEYDQMEGREQAYEIFSRNILRRYPTRTKLYRMYSDDAVKKFKDGTIDFVFIDGLHTDEQVKKDIENYYPKLKSGGLMCGHDYHSWRLAAAVNDMVLRCSGKTVSTCRQDVWYFYKD